MVVVNRAPADLAAAYATRSLRELAAHYGVGYHQVRAWLQAAGIAFHPPGAAANPARQLSLADCDKLRERYTVTTLANALQLDWRQASQLLRGEAVPAEGLTRALALLAKVKSPGQ